MGFFSNKVAIKQIATSSLSGSLPDPSIQHKIFLSYES